jgi:hypothetical protein
MNDIKENSRQSRLDLDGIPHQRRSMSSHTGISRTDRIYAAGDRFRQQGILERATISLERPESD